MQNVTFIVQLIESIITYDDELLTVYISSGLPCAHIAKECDLFPIFILIVNEEAARSIVSETEN